MSNSSAKSKRISRAAARKAASDADDLETAALRAGTSVKVSLDESVYSTALSEEGSEELVGDSEEVDPVKEVLEEDAASEQLVGAALAVVQERINLLGDLYPFRLSDTDMEYVGSRTLVYELCLAIANVNVSANPYKQLQLAFERLAGVAMRIILGSGAESLRTGYPPDSDADTTSEPRSFAGAIQTLNEKMPNEWVMDPNTLLQDPADGGMDIVVWKKIDGRTGSLVYVGNCGCGSNWLSDKKHWERPSESLGKLLSRPKPYLVNDFFCLPFHINEKRDWEDACDRGRFVLDRLRLARTAESATDEWTASGQSTGTMRDLIRVADAEFKPGVRTLPDV